MKILSRKETGLGGAWILVDYGNDFYAYGCEQDLHTLLGFPVDQCGTKAEVNAHCKSIAELCKKNIKTCQKELAKGKSDGWKIMIEHEQKELEMLTEFSQILST